jgi:putative transposase
MPRRPRTVIPGVPLHIVQRGNDKQACFIDSLDYGVYLKALGESSIMYNVSVHAYALMTNHVHLLVTPHAAVGASRMMQWLGRRYVLYFNQTHSRSGTLWEGRFRSSPVQTDRYLFACYRYIELNPVRAGIVASPEHYRWSSYCSNALGRPSGLLTPHRIWLSLGESREDRQATYVRLFSLGNSSDEEHQIRAAYRKGRPLE